MTCSPYFITVSFLFHYLISVAVQQDAFIIGVIYIGTEQILAYFWLD